MPNAPTALVVLSSGIGNVVRWTPMVTMLVESGYRVDVHLAGVDYPEVGTLLAHGPGVSQVTLGMVPQGYDLACVSYWAGDVLVDAARIDRMPAKLWQQLGDPGAMLWHAARIGWEKPIPAPFVMKSDRQFDLPSGTLAIHAGCKPGWPWKRYPHFPAIARQFEHVVIVGTKDDSIGEPWPFHVRDYMGQLSLLDTAALLSQCSALVCNDSGLSHVGAALGILTVPIYGATSASREAMDLPNVFAIGNQAMCHRACSHVGAGRCMDRPHTPFCLTTLSADTVGYIVRSQMPELAA